MKPPILLTGVQYVAGGWISELMPAITVTRSATVIGLTVSVRDHVAFRAVGAPIIVGWESNIMKNVVVWVVVPAGIRVLEVISLAAIARSDMETPTASRITMSFV